MTSLKFFENPHIVKLDRRYKLYSQGFRYRIDFSVYGDDNNKRWVDAVEWCARTWGKEHEWRDVTRPASYNSNYRTHWPMTMRERSFRQLYLRTEEAVTMLLLVIGR